MILGKQDLRFQRRKALILFTVMTNVCDDLRDYDLRQQCRDVVHVHGSLKHNDSLKHMAH